MAQSDYQTKNVDLLIDLASRADTRVAAQLTAAIAADQRAMTFAGFLAAAVAVLGGAAASILTGTSVNHSLGLIALYAASATTVSLALTIFAARPTRFYSPGSQPKDWREDIALDRSDEAILPALLADYDTRIDRNERTMRDNGAIVSLAAIILIVSYVICGASIGLHLRKAATSSSAAVGCAPSPSCSGGTSRTSPSQNVPTKSSGG